MIIFREKSSVLNKAWLRIIALLLACLSYSVQGDVEIQKENIENYKIDILIGEESEAYEKFLNAISSSHETYKNNISLIKELSGTRTYKRNSEKWVLVTTGHHFEQASDHALDYDAVIAFYITPSEYRNSLKDFYINNPTLPVSAIYSTPPTDRQILLSKTLIPNLGTIGIIYTEEGKHIVNSLSASAKRHGLKTETQVVKHLDSMPQDLGALLRKSDVLIAHKELGTYTPSTIRTILLSSYRQRKAVIGLSVPYIKAGVLATTSSNIEQLTETLESQIRHFDRTNSLPPPAYPEKFNVEINKQVLSSLGIEAPDIDSIRRAISEQEKGINNVQIRD